MAQRFQDKVTYIRENFPPIILTDLNQPMAVQAASRAYECWISDTGNDRILKMVQDEITLSVTGNFLLPARMAMNDFTGSFWVIDSANNRLVKINNDGEIIREIIGLNGPWDISINLDQ